MKFDPIPGCYTTVEYDTGKPYEVDNTLELIDDDDLLGIADSVAEITVTRGQVDKLIEYLKMWRNSKSTSPYDMGGGSGKNENRFGMSDMWAHSYHQARAEGLVLVATSKDYGTVSRV